MWDSLLVLVLFCIVMASASFLAGSVPLSFSLSQRHLRLITALGTGVLVGTSLIVIIPEGIETLYSASGAAHSHGRRSVPATLYERGSQPEVLWESMLHGMNRGDDLPMDSGSAESVLPNRGFVTGPDDGHDTAKLDITTLDTPAQPGHEEHSYIPASEQKGGLPETGNMEEPAVSHDETGHDPHAYISLSLIAGFILMYLIDNVPRHINTSSRPQRTHINLDRFSLNGPSSTAHEDSEATTRASISHEHETTRPSSTTVGLVIHAAADGIALGASSTSTSKLSFIIFLALMIHKAPAAFGLTSVLLKQGLGKRAARTHLLIFSLAAPVGAILTWFAAQFFEFNASSDETSTEFASGVLLLFSGGTFLYVAMHTMQETGHSHDQSYTNGYAEVPMGIYGAPPPEAPAIGGMTETLVCATGMLLPLLTRWGHVH